MLFSLNKENAAICDNMDGLWRHYTVQVKKQQLEPDMEQTGSKLWKEYSKSLYCHPAYLAYMQSTSYKMLGWMKHKLESRLLGEISITSDMQITPSLWQKPKNQRASWWKKRRRVKSWLKTQIQKTNIMAFSPITSWQIDWEKMETVTDYFCVLQNQYEWWLQPWN